MACTGAVLASVVGEIKAGWLHVAFSIKAGWLHIAFSINDKEATVYKVYALCIEWPHDEALFTRAPNPTVSAHSGWLKAGWLSIAFSIKAGWFSFAFSIKDKATVYKVYILIFKWPCDKAPTTRAPAASSARSGKLKTIIEMKLELNRQPGGREAGMDFEDKCVSSVGGIKGAATPEQAHGEAVLKSAQDDSSDRSVHTLFVTTDVTGGACSTEGLTAGVDTLPAA
jgi:hypothetical protein